MQITSRDTNKQSRVDGRSEAPTRYPIDLLLATYNGAAYLPETLASLRNQTDQSWRLIVRDDGSSDGSLDLIERWATDIPERVVIVRDGRTRLGASGNFNALLALAEAPYAMPCDQDDVWLPDKIERTLDIARRMEAQCGPETPICVFSDLHVVDGAGDLIHPSVWRYQGLNPDNGNNLGRLLIQNVVNGNTMVVNAALLKAALPVPENAFVYDWWLALVGAAFGRVGYLPEATVRYRQHGSNSYGAKDWSSWRAWLDVARRPAAVATQKREVLCRTQRQAGAFQARFGDVLSSDHSAVVDGYATLAKRGFFERRLFVARHDLWFRNPIKNLGLLALI